jgi:class 3 adenylate cyclase/tetratricopeptide (TPR) repeat protein
MKCPKCQFENREEAIFCRGCGASLKSDISCPNCEASNPPDSKFCEKCGQDLKSPKASPPLNYSEPQSYTPKFLADKILTSRSSIEGERKLVTVLFADAANSTAMFEKLDPEDVHIIMDGCLRFLMDEVHRYEGTVNQFLGDGVMAIFGAPVAHEDHAQRACFSSLSIVKAAQQYAAKLNKEYRIDFKLRIGLNSGSVVVGSIGDDLRMDYTADGDVTNLASRMESLAKPGTILVSGDTYRLVRDYFVFEFLGKVEVKGKEEPQEAFELLNPSEVKTRIGASVAKGLSRLVGRKNSIAALREVYEKVRSGKGQVVGVVGEAGVGKSRLLMEFERSILENENTYLIGQCYHYGGSMAYLPLRDILRSYFGVEDSDQEFVIKKKMKEKIVCLDDKLLSSLSPLMSLLSLKVEDETWQKLQPKDRREKTFKGLCDLFMRLSQEKPLVLAVEDLHWIDKTSEDFLTYLIGGIAGSKILLILLYRTEYAHQWDSKTYYTKIGLNQLGLQSSAELISEILEGGEVAPELQELMFDRSAGNPLFLEEMAYSLLENKFVKKVDNQYVLSRQVSDLKVPDTLQGIIAARIDRLEDNLKRTMQMASVIGRDFAFRILQKTTGMREELKSYLFYLQGLEFIYEKQLLSELEYIFKHALTQEVAYNSLLRKKRKKLHEKIGQAIEEIYPDRLEEFQEMLAYHYSKSPDLNKACKYLKLAAANATSRYSTMESFTYYRETLLILKKYPQTIENQKEQIEIIHLMSGPMFILGYPEDSLQILEYGERLSKELGDDRSLGIFYSWIGRFFTIRKGDPLLGVKYAEKSFDQAEKIQDVDLVTRAGFDLCTPYNISGQFYKQVEVSQKVVNLIEKAEKVNESFGTGLNLYSLLNGYVGFANGMLGRFEKGKLFLDKGINFASEISDKTVLGHLQYLYGWICLVEGAGENTIAHFQKSIRFIEEVKYFAILSTALTGLGWGYYLKGEMETAQRYIEKGLKAQNESGISFFLSTHHLALSIIHYDFEYYEKAFKRIEEALRLSQKNKENHFEGYSKIWFGRILGKMKPSQTEKAEEFMVQGINILEDLMIKPWSTQGYLFLGELYTNTGQRDKAPENLKKAEHLFKEMGMDYWLAKTNEVMGSL